MSSVNLLGNGIGEAAADIVRAAEQHGKIQTLCGIKPDQKEANFSSQELKDADAVLLAYDIKVNAPLKSLSIGTNKLGVEGVGVLCESLKTNTTLETLDMQGARENKLGAAEAKIIANMLKVNAPLTDLDISLNNIGVDGAKAIAAVLPRCVQLQNGMRSAPPDARN